ncbi:hypothetical protein J1N35_045319 [Gossypium stocksii]|uniref:MULE transposase domain-containing protein n=1 Tax=Gossypium stocksii TaxID=47602 RepID=A0A9D3UB60_9ROSI|nr:hypothetical protein J1N35_045319 [Gossypium stocksii]
MVTLYCGTRSNQNAPIQLFAELIGVEPTEDPTPLGEEHGVQELCMVVPISYVDSQSTIHEIDIDLNTAPETDVVGDDVYHSSDPSDDEVDSDSDPDMYEIPNDIDDEDLNDNRNINAPDAAHAVEFPEYLEILPTHRLVVDSDPEELLVVRDLKILLFTVVQDGNKNVLMIAFVIVDKENMESWEFFLTNLWRRFQTLHYPCKHVVVACAKVSLNVEQFMDKVYTIECTLRV